MFPVRQRRKHVRAGLAALGLATALALSVGPAPAHAASGGADEAILLWLLNVERHERGLAPLRLEAALDAGAATHAVALAQRGELHHTGMADSAPAGWTRLGENVGRGDDAHQIHRALMGSPAHRGAMLDPAFDYVGIRVAHGSGTSHWLSMKLADHPSGELPLGASSTDPRRTVSGRGIVTAADGATFHGDLRSSSPAAPVVALVATPSGAGYWLAAADGGVFSFGDARFFGSAGTLRLARPIVGMTAMPDGSGYWLVGADGGVFAFGGAPYLGAPAGTPLLAPMVRINRTATGRGYALFDAAGRRLGFGDARSL